MAEYEHHQPPLSAADSAPEMWKELGRDTEAGKMLFKLYGGNRIGTSVGNSYDTINRRKHDAKLQTGWTPPPIEKAAPTPPPRATIQYPSFGPKFKMPAPVERIPHRRPGTQILRELEADMERQRHHRPNPKGPLLDDKEKERFALLMRYRGKLPVATEEELEKCRAHKGQTLKPKDTLQELQGMFQQVATEIEERREFLRQLESHGKLKQDTQNQIRRELQQRVFDLAKIDQLIQKENRS